MAYRRTDSINRSRGHWHEEERSAAAVRNMPPLWKRNPTQAEQDALEKYAKACGKPVLTAAEYATLAQHPMISEAKRAEFTAAANPALVAA